MRHMRVAVLVTLLLASGIGVWAQDPESVATGTVTVKQATVLRSGPANGAPTLQPLPQGITLRWIEGQKRGTFYRVVVPRGPQGWVPEGAVDVASPPPSPPMVVLAAKPPCAPSLATCPVTGCATPGTPHALFNERKRGTPSGGEPITLTFSDFGTLQDQANELVGQGEDLSAADLARLTSLTVSAGTVEEGRLVQITGFIAKGKPPHASSGESINCRRLGSQNNDFHIALAESASDTEFDGIVVEMIPQDRPAQWTISKLTAVRAAKRRVLAIGALFYDNLHFVNSDPANPLGGQPHRFSLWEVHPLTKFLVCKKTSNTCDSSLPSDWMPLETFQP